MTSHLKLKSKFNPELLCIIYTYAVDTIKSQYEFICNRGKLSQAKWLETIYKLSWLQCSYDLSKEELNNNTTKVFQLLRIACRSGKASIVLWMLDKYET